LKEGDLVELTSDGKMIYGKHNYIWPSTVKELDWSQWGEPFWYLDNGATISERGMLQMALENICEQEE
jgi:hypothetical protein